MDNENVRFVVKIRAILGMNTTAIHEEFTTTLGPLAPSYRTVARWEKRFREGREDLNDDQRSESPVSETTDENIELVRQVIDNDPHSTYDEIIGETSLSYGTLERIIHDHLKLKKLTSRWVPYELSDEQKQERLKICRQNLAKFRDGSWQLCNIITGDKTWIYWRQIHRKATNASWVGEGESLTTVVRRSKFEPKTLFSIFFKSNSPILIHAVNKGKTIDHNYYIE
jgi:transposase